MSKKRAPGRSLDEWMELVTVHWGSDPMKYYMKGKCDD